MEKGGCVLSDGSFLECDVAVGCIGFERNTTFCEQLTGRSAPQLLARHHFKRAYYSEFRRDAASAFKHWTSCYGYIREILRLITTLIERTADQADTFSASISSFIHQNATHVAFCTSSEMSCRS